MREVQASYAATNLAHLGLHASSRSGLWSTGSSSSDLSGGGERRGDDRVKREWGESGGEQGLGWREDVSQPIPMVDEAQEDAEEDWM